MRNFLALLIVVSVASVTVAQTLDDVVARAIKAHGGADALAKMKAFERSGKGRVTMINAEVDAIYVAKLALPDRALFTVDMTRSDAKMKTTIGLNGLSGWVQANNDPAKDLGSSQFDLMADESWVHYLCTIGPLGNKNLKLVAVAETKVDGQSADGVKVTKDGKPDVTFYFSKASNLLVKAEAKIKDGANTFNKEWIFAEHKEFSGVKLPTKVTDLQSGTRQAQWAGVEYKFVDKFDLAIFRKP